MNNDQIYNKWQSWINIIMEDIQTVYFHRSMYDGLKEIVDKYEEADKECLFFSFLQNVYIDSLVMGLRRQIKNGTNKDNSISLVRLLEDIKKHPEVVTRESYYALWDQKHLININFAARAFSEYAEPDENQIDISRVEKDISMITEICKTAEYYADKRVAHRDKGVLKHDVTLEEILSALDSVGATVKKYFQLFTAKDMELYPIPQELPWPRPWIDLYFQKKRKI
jgi:hypothetical protein